MSFNLRKKEIEKGKANCLLCRKPVVENGQAFLIQQVKSNPADTIVRYSLNGQRKFLAHHECLVSYMFSQDFPNINVEPFYLKYLELRRKSNKPVWMLADQVIDEEITQEEFDGCATRVAKKVLQEYGNE